MENEKFLPTGWHWKITPEQIEKIKQRDRDTVNQVYFDNLDKFRAMAYKFCCFRKLYNDIEDCIQQIYVDLISYDFSNSGALFWSIRRSFYRAVGLTNYISQSLDDPVGNDDSNSILADMIPIFDTTEKEYDDKENERRVLEIIARQTHLTNTQKDVMTAFAFGCFAYSGLFDYAYKQAYSA